MIHHNGVNREGVKHYGVNSEGVKHNGVNSDGATQNWVNSEGATYNSNIFGSAAGDQGGYVRQMFQLLSSLTKPERS